MEDINSTIIDTADDIHNLVDRFTELGHVNNPTIYIDLEGVYLCRDGSISILTLLFNTGLPKPDVVIIDVHKLGKQAFETTVAKGSTLKGILEDKRFTKVFFDVRNDSDALFSHFGVVLERIEDVQLMESATRKTTTSRKFVTGLTKCVENNVFRGIHWNDRRGWLMAKSKGEQFFKKEYGGSHEVFNKRPISDDIISYCVADVQYLPKLREIFWTSQNSQWRDLVVAKSMERVVASRRSDYQPHGQDRVVAPWSEEEHATLNLLNYTPSPNYLNHFEPDDAWYERDDWDNEEDEDWDNSSSPRIGKASRKYQKDVRPKPV
ncbi:hypothetical protein BU24DRAFT_480222 [Aaosphaeria arxii CBS 175.79]|uniref:3'-5' exonuclease domain-containing protein n=1 Tax=Aaosphaeria arxii CBS 175.79 TaxID=1450172 RepID=A0A6A5XRD4_9PLEO|nr:uncharacterized protein BU24DRAFT_480222 [Aaosphaeria arxii CBS 175.79]KAF2015456.1 hypothetical protein BU24DRAFT_480222 [Aaosphaeria arxii CBS 175.79]